MLSGVDAPPSDGAKEIRMSDIQALYKLFTSLFGTTPALRKHFTLHLDPRLVHSLPGANASMESTAFEAASLLRRRGEIDATLFRSLLDEFDGRRDDILTVARACNVELPDIDSAPPSPSASSSADAGRRKLKKGPLRRLLLLLYTDGGLLKDFLEDLEGTLDVRQVPWSADQTSIARRVVELLLAEGLVNDALFDELIEDKPGQRDAIERVRKLYTR